MKKYIRLIRFLIFGVSLQFIFADTVKSMRIIATANVSGEIEPCG
tara:strand:- start:212 stop:346 length:135 start_codon:yes stop_codon:yes gene_type:complete